MKTYTIKSETYNLKQDLLSGETFVESAIVSEQTIRDLIKANPELLKDEKKFKFFKPNIDDTTYYLNQNGILDDEYEGFDGEDEIINRGVYATKEEATLADEKRMAIVRCWNWADEFAYFRPDWSDDNQTKYFVFYFNSRKTFEVNSANSIQYEFTLPYFKSQEDAEAFINANKADLEKLFLE